MPHLVIPQAESTGHVFFRLAFGHMYTFQCVVLQRLSSILPGCWLNAPETLGCETRSSTRVAVGIVVGVVLLVEGLRGDFTKEQEACPFAQTGTDGAGRADEENARVKKKCKTN